LSAKKASVTPPTKCATCSATGVPLTVVSAGEQDLVCCATCAAQLVSYGFTWAD
jgi:hypothetical protein